MAYLQAALRRMEGTIGNADCDLHFTKRFECYRTRGILDLSSSS